MNDEPRPFEDIFAEECKSIRGAGSDPGPLTALCLSGGGIRSATFGLGVLQGLADRGLLEQFDYLSTVSGGGYIGGWLTAWIQRAGGVDKVAPRLRTNCPAPPASETDPIEHLRRFNSYLTPRLGSFSADTWTLIATVGRNILLNWLVLIPLILGVLMLPRIMVSVMSYAENFFGQPPSEWPLVVDAGLFMGIVFAGVSIYNNVRFLPAVGNQPHTQADFIRLALIPLVASALLVNCAYSWSPNGPPFHDALTVGLTICFSGWVLFLIQEALKSPKRAGKLLFGPITLALGLAGTFTGAGIWVLHNKIAYYGDIGYADMAAIAPPFLIGCFLTASAMFVGVTSNVLNEDDREWLSRAGAFILLFVVFWLLSCGLVLEAPALLFKLEGWKQSIIASAGFATAAISALGGFSGKTRPKKDDRRTAPWQYRFALALAPPLFIVLMVMGLSAWTNWVLSHAGLTSQPWWDHIHLLNNTGIRANALLAAIFFALGLTMSYFININRFSLHGMYRNRLVRAYLGASNTKRNASPFTGFAENDNIRMRDLDPKQRPFHILNLTLNLVAGANLAWQQRKAQSFTVSPLHCGNADLGYRSSVAYGHGISLGTAMTISGAAASPSMGYHSSTLVAFIMTLFNARLGAWLGNPGVGGSKTWRDNGPRYAVSSLAKEALGLTNNTSSYVYLSDGGHFENLGLYEMVRRRCGYIVAVDAGCDLDFTFEDLGNAIRKIRIDFRIPIEFDEKQSKLLRDGKKRCVVGRIRYSCVDGSCQDGYLIYIKPVFLGGEPADVQSYRSGKPDFPHESTANQWFTESQTESYRMLGLHTVKEICGSWENGPIDSFRQHIEEEYLAHPPRRVEAARAASGEQHA